MNLTIGSSTTIYSIPDYKYDQSFFDKIDRSIVESYAWKFESPEIINDIQLMIFRICKSYIRKDKLKKMIGV